MTEKMLTYALGRGLEYYDMPVVRADRARRRRAELPVLVDRAGHREEHAVPDEVKAPDGVVAVERQAVSGN